MCAGGREDYGSRHYHASGVSYGTSCGMRPLDSSIAPHSACVIGSFADLINLGIYRHCNRLDGLHCQCSGLHFQHRNRGHNITSPLWNALAVKAQLLGL